MIKIKTKKKVRQCHKQVEVSEKKRTIRENKEKPKRRAEVFSL